MECPPYDEGTWDWYDARFGWSVRITELDRAVIDYGDGKSYESTTEEDLEANMFWHRYQSPGRFDVVVNVWDTAGRAGRASCVFEWSDSGATSEGSAGCDPNYEGDCVPIASDVDCASGSGDGPAYVWGPVYVVGYDIHDLDGNGDGVGCE